MIVSIFLNLWYKKHHIKENSAGFGKLNATTGKYEWFYCGLAFEWPMTLGNSCCLRNAGYYILDGCLFSNLANYFCSF